MKRNLLSIALLGTSMWAMAAAGPICGGELHCDQTNPACPDPTAYVNWETESNGDIAISIYKDSQTAWRGRGMASAVTGAKGWVMTIDGVAVDIANYFEKDYAEPTSQASAPKVYRLKLKDGVERPTGTVVINFTPVDNICWWTALDNNGWGKKMNFSYLYGSTCTSVATPEITNIATDSTITITEVEGALSYTIRIYYEGTLYAVYDNIQSGDQLHFPAVATADYAVTATAILADNVSEESDAYTWSLEVSAPELGQSEVCAMPFSSDTYEGGPTNVEDSRMSISMETIDGNVVVRIVSETTVANDSALFRKDDALGMAAFSINGAPASGFFWTYSKDGEKTYVMRLREGKSLPEGTVIDYKGTLQWKNTQFTNAYRRNTVLHYTYGTTCEDEPTGFETAECNVQSAARKVIIRGQLLLMRDGRMFDSMGREVNL